MQYVQASSKSKIYAIYPQRLYNYTYIYRTPASTPQQTRGHEKAFGGTAPQNFFLSHKFCCAQKNLF